MTLEKTLGNVFHYSRCSRLYPTTTHTISLHLLSLSQLPLFLSLSVFVLHDKNKISNIWYGTIVVESNLLN